MVKQKVIIKIKDHNSNCKSSKQWEHVSAKFFATFMIFQRSLGKVYYQPKSNVYFWGSRRCTFTTQWILSVNLWRCLCVLQKRRFLCKKIFWKFCLRRCHVTYAKPKKRQSIFKTLFSFARFLLQHRDENHQKWISSFLLKWLLHTILNVFITILSAYRGL